MARRAPSSTSTSTTTGRGQDVRSFSGQGRTLNNLLFLAACMAIMIGSFWAFASYPDNPLVWVIGLLLYGLALLVPVSLLRSSTAKRAEGGRTVAMDVPTTTEVAGAERTAADFGQGPQDVRERDARTAAVHHGDKYGKVVE
ncbi:hypothetical protein ACH9EU_17990 [Kocuria sp. M1R5S2]|uniref:hypothetical protein n=1 Tax=Kocuria rhizosphaerae TaxID=3376285 RepID=UPI0037A75A0B